MPRGTKEIAGLGFAWEGSVPRLKLCNTIFITIPLPQLLFVSIELENESKKITKKFDFCFLF